MWLTALESEDGSWADDPLTTDGLKELAINNAQCMWPVIPPGHRIALYRCDFVQEVDQWAPAGAKHARTESE